MVCVAVREVVGAAPAGLLAGGAGMGETMTVLGAAGIALAVLGAAGVGLPVLVGAAGVWLAVTGQKVVYMAIVEVMVRAGQSLTVDAHWVTVYSVVA